MSHIPGAPPLTDLGQIKQKLHIVLQSFGVKSGLEFPKADLYLDVRGVAEPMGMGMSGNGDDPHIQAWVVAHSDVLNYYTLLVEALTRLTTRRGAGHEFDKPFVVVTMCAHGIHRSRAMKHIIAKQLKGLAYQHVEVK